MKKNRPLRQGNPSLGKVSSKFLAKIICDFSEEKKTRLFYPNIISGFVFFFCHFRRRYNFKTKRYLQKWKLILLKWPQNQRHRPMNNWRWIKWLKRNLSGFKSRYCFQWWKVNNHQSSIDCVRGHCDWPDFFQT